MFIFRIGGFGLHQEEGRLTILILTMPKFFSSKARYARPPDYCSLHPSTLPLEAGFDTLISIISTHSIPVSLPAITPLPLPHSISVSPGHNTLDTTPKNHSRCRRRWLVWRRNRLQQSLPSSRRRKPKKAARCTGDRARVGRDLPRSRYQDSHRMSQAASHVGYAGRSATRARAFVEHATTWD